MKLIDRTRQMLEAAQSADISLMQIAEKAADVDYEWLKKFATGKIPDPSVNRVQALHDYLVVLNKTTPLAVSDPGNRADA